MRVVIAGGSGIVGSALRKELAAKGHQVQVLTRHAGDGAPSSSLLQWHPPSVEGPWVDAVGAADAVINLAGSSLANGRWTRSRMVDHRSSRLNATAAIVEAMRRAPTPSSRRVLVNASAVGYYGDREDEVLIESSPPGSDVLARLCVDWENAALQAESTGLRVVLIRTGVVFGSAGGLPRLLLPFRFFAGGPLGSGKQWMSWIHELDEARLITFAMETSSVSAALNATAPQPAREADIAREIGRLLGRPSFVPAPASLLRIALGRMAGALLLASQRAIPAAAQKAGFQFEYPSLNSALGSLLRH